MAHRFRRSAALAALLLAATLIATSSGLAQTPTPTPAPLGGQAAQAEGQGVELTVYNQDLGLVKEVRTLDLAEGVTEVRFTDVASRINPTSVQVVSLTDPEGTTVLEQNYEYDIVGSEKLLAKYVDQVVTVMTTEGDSYTGTLLSGKRDIILSTEEGIKLIKLDQVREFTFPELPEGLITRPTLVWLLDSAEAGEQDVQVTYMTGGINWRADYVATLAADDGSVALTGWVTVDNQTGTAYRDARLKLVAGDVHRAETYARDAGLMAEAAMPAPTMAPQVTERAFFEYHLYEVQRPVTLRDAQTKQIEFVSAPEVGVAKVYVYESMPYWGYYGVITDSSYGTSSDRKVEVRLEFVNDEESGLGLPLPRGIVRVYKEDVGGGTEFVGEDTIDHTPRDEELSLLLGNAFDLVGERKQVSFRKLGSRLIEETVEVTLRNHKDEDVTIRAIEHLYRSPDAEIIEASHEFKMVDARTARFDVDVPVDGEVAVTYTVRYRW